MKYMQAFTITGEDELKIAVLSGKGGTGKTLLSVNLAATAKHSVYIDCDVEEPNGHLFFKPTDIMTENVFVKIPSVDDTLCSGCRKCVDFCKFNALAYVKNKLLIFNEICHSCGGCTMLCPQNALTEKEKAIGHIQKGFSNNVNVISGFLNPGEASGVPIIKKLLSEPESDSELVFIDCPPGSACIVMESIKDADYCILTAEPTLFGVHNLQMVHELLTIFDKPYGAVINKCLEGANPAEDYCKEHNIKILGNIRFDSKLGYLNSNAQIAALENKKFGSLFTSLLHTILEEAQK